MVPRLSGKAVKSNWKLGSSPDHGHNYATKNWNGEGAATVHGAGICSFQSGRWALPPTWTQRGGDSLIWEGSSGARGPNSV